MSLLSIVLFVGSVSYFLMFLYVYFCSMIKGRDGHFYYTDQGEEPGAQVPDGQTPHAVV